MFSVFRCCSKVTTFVSLICTFVICVPKNMSCPQYKAIVFDSYGTLIDVNTLLPTTLNVVNSTDKTIATTLISLWRRQQLEYTWLKSLMTDSYQDFWTVTKNALEFSLAKLSLSLTQLQQDDLMNGWLQLSTFPDVEESLTKLKPNYQLAVLSNGTPRMLREVFKSSGLNDFIDHVNEISVDEVRVFKPHPKVYGLVEKKLCVSKSEILFVSGNSWDVIGAKSYGLQSVWINRNDEPEHYLGASADMEFSDLNQLAIHLSSS